MSDKTPERPDNPPPHDKGSSSDGTIPGHSTRGGPPKRIGNYVIKRRIASGGMGTVYEAMQEQPRRPAAVKLMRRGVSSAHALRRFEYEAQLLARLRHPHIAQIFEAGTYDDGTEKIPFFAMEYIPNPKSITEYVFAKKLNTEDRLRMFAVVCDAVHHGHQKGIIHRDLKPDNILVDSHGEPKIIDFGVARATDSDLALTTMQTEVGQLVGTLQYMSPEQIEADPHDIDIRSDVYALGIVLYEMLTGRQPYDLGSRPVLEAGRIIREEEPKKPSTIDRRIGGDIETIVLKALEKDRDRRYQSAASLAGDIRRFLNDEPIIARPPSLGYQLSVFARRNRALVVATGAVLLALAAGTVVSTSLYLRAESERVRAEEQRARAEEQSEKAMSSIGYVLEMVKSADPSCLGEEVKVGDLLDSYSKKIEEAFAGQPELEAAVRTALGESCKYLDNFEYAGQRDKYKADARNHFERALALRRTHFGENSSEAISSMYDLADVFELEGDYKGSERLKRRGWELFKQENGPEDDYTLSAASELAENLYHQGRSSEALPLMEEVVEVSRRLYGDRDKWVLGHMRQYARVLMDVGRFDEAEQLRRHAFEAAQADSFSWGEKRGARGDLANSLLAMGRVDEARSLYPDRRLPENLGIKKWINGNVNVSSGEPTLLVFWEEWCPYSTRQIPRLRKLHETYGENIRVVGMTGFSEEKTRECIDALNVSFPNAHVDGEARKELEAGGFPDSFLFVDNEVVWHDHPIRLSKHMFEGLLNGSGARSDAGQSRLTAAGES
ncbi:MAG: protein kinase [Gemmatimonadetes bacterium]|nr:protein kinase [Gemmatimonadota bacterium]